MAIRNRLKYWRHRLEMDKQTEYAGFLGVDNGQLNRWEQQKVQPGLETMYRIWKHLKTKFPEINMQDLIEDESP